METRRLLYPAARQYRTALPILDHAVVYYVVYGTLENVGPHKNFLHVTSKGSPDFPLLETAARRGSAYAHIVNMLYPQDTKSGYISIRHEPYPVRVN